MNLGMRLLLGLFVAGVFGGISSGLGSLIGAVGSVVVATRISLLGFVCGCCSPELYAIIRSSVKSEHDP